jgi:hypothetical protein
MNNYYVLAALAGIVLLGYFSLHTYTSSPGYTTQEYAVQFFANKPTCYGIDILLNENAASADSPGKSLCIGLLK